MAHRRKDKLEKKIVEEEEAEEEEELNFKKWIIKTIMMMCFLLVLVLMTEYMFNVDILRDVVIAIAITVSIGFIHEGLHYRKAKELGYNVEWFRTRFTMGFDIKKKNTKTWSKDMKAIGIAPYKYIFPISFIPLVFGVLLSSLGLVVAGIVSIVLHIFTYTKEGKEI